VTTKAQGLCKNGPSKGSMESVNKNFITLTNEIPAVSHLLIILDIQAHAHTYEQQDGTCSRCGFLCSAYVRTVQRKGRARIVDQSKIFFSFLFFSECCAFTRWWIGSLWGCVPAQWEERQKGYSGNRRFLCQGFLPETGRTMFAVARTDSFHNSVFISLVQL